MKGKNIIGYKYGKLTVLGDDGDRELNFIEGEGYE